MPVFGQESQEILISEMDFLNLYLDNTFDIKMIHTDVQAACEKAKIAFHLLEVRFLLKDHIPTASPAIPCRCIKSLWPADLCQPTCKSSTQTLLPDWVLMLLSGRLGLIRKSKAESNIQKMTVRRQI